MQIGAVILGAGFGRRFGTDKRAAKLGDTTVAQATCTRYVDAFPAVRVVLRVNDTELTQRLTDLGCEIVYCEQAHLGMGHSLASGITNLQWDWAFVGLLDMPFIRSDTLRQLQHAAQTAAPSVKVIQPRWLNQGATFTGHPVGFQRRLFADIANLSGDQGAKSIVAQYTDQLVHLDIADPGLVQDIDTPADLQKFNS